MNAQERKEYPLFRGLFKYFPNALMEVSHVSYIGNKQHNKGQPLHWAREKSTDQLDAAMRHILNYAQGHPLDEDGERHLAKAIWRVCAQLQLDLENEKK